ncbi:small conductance calcium-activated potassium channel protein 2 [Nematostella vectensis]|uniref:small conductance calcium-activated potassium channel protein 2 n=1 Tax=Nematostella vectensis TaxID=45351 RepID=UPI0020777CC1|nr:small conductance calcium-activated potassium channel protein 2 [Nematostella vectensis]
MESSETRSRSLSTSDRYELNHLNSSPNGKSDMNRYRRTNSSVTPGTFGNFTRTGSQKRSMRSSIRSDMPSFDQTLRSFRDIDTAKKFFHRRIRILSGLSCLMGVSAVVLAIIDIEIAKHRPEKLLNGQLQVADSLSASKDAFGIAGIVLKAAISLFSLLTCITIFNIYSNTRKLNVVKNLFHESESFLTSRTLLPRFLLETLICLTHIPPYVDDLGIPYKLQLLVFIRLYLLTRCLRERSKFFNNQATSLLASVTKTEISSTFLVKTYFLKEPFKLIFSFYTMNIFLGGYCVYVIEDSHPYLDTVWMMVVTMTTLGFGDIVPVSVVARGLVGFASILGIFLMALFISVVHEYLQLTNQEKRILAYIEKADHQQEKMEKAAACIQSCWRYRQFVKRHMKSLELGDWLKLQRMRFLQHKLFECMRQWRGMRRTWARDDYWRKLFVVDDTAMLLTDVCRSVTNIEKCLHIPPASRKRSSSRPSLSRHASYGSPPARIREEDALERPPVSPNVFPPISPSREKANSLQTVLVESLETRDKPEKRISNPAIQVVALPREIPRICANHTGISPANKTDRDFDRNKRAFLNRPQAARKASDLSTSSDHIDRGAMTFDMLQSRIEGVESALDQIYGKVKSELRDIKDTVSTMAAAGHFNTPSSSPGALPSQVGSTSDPLFSYATMDKYDI